MKNTEMNELNMDQLDNITGGINFYPFDKPIVKPTSDSSIPQRINFLDKMKQPVMSVEKEQTQFYPRKEII